MAIENSSEKPQEHEKNKIIALLDEIYRIKKEKFLSMEKLVEAHTELIKKANDARENLTKAEGKINIMKWKEVIVSLATEKVILQEKRHLLKQYDTEEARLKARLLELEEE